ncbi:hypothetical protein MHM98_14515 [Psychrobium sp. MM17-31]|uniref:hypothetical protein n=1 Tax=Psychrobium sp. MM17-31 TaxID=2917758 RepID=UPI001EF4BFA4|nr:hypothetical protein [Psychrobium sp. MM17-31]MCG7532549.1 hypothetical protein [Psychrobium sp. MM17-31]
MKFRLLILISGILTLFGCGLAAQVEETDALMESFYAERADGQNVDRYYAKMFWDATSQQEWKNIISLVKKAHGTLNSHEQVNWNIKSTSHTNQLSGTFVSYVYNAHHEVGVVTEYLTLFREDDDDEFKILSHRFDSQEIKELVNKGIQQVATE